MKSKYIKRTKTSKRKLKSKKLKGGGITYDAAKGKLTDIINDTTKLKEFNNKMIQFYKEKIKKYETLKKKTNDDIRDLLQVDKNSKSSLIEGIENTADGIIADGQKDAVIRENDKIKNRISDNARMSIYAMKIEQILARIRLLTGNGSNCDFLKNSMKDFLKACDDFDLGNVTDYRIKLIEYLLSIYENIHPLDTYDPFNVILLGSPGVGKSYNSIKIAELLKKSLILAGGTLHNVKKDEIIGQYIGQTAPRVYHKLAMALEGVVFIDEAYSLAGEKSNNGFDTFGTEAISAIVDFTSEHTGLLSVIAAGYENEMKKQFIEVNAGLERRFPPKLRYKLERYNVKDLLKIAKNSLDKETKNLDFEYKNILLGCLVTIISRLVWFFDYTTSNDIPNLKKTIEQEVENVINKNIKFKTGDYVWVYRNSGKWEKDWVIQGEQDDQDQYVVVKDQLQKLIKPFYIRRDMEMDSNNKKPYSSYKLIPFEINIISDKDEDEYILTSVLRTTDNDETVHRKVWGQSVKGINGIEWFHLVQMLEACTDLKDGDLFKNQAADISEFTITFLKTYARHPKDNTDKTLKDLMEDTIDTIMNDKGIQTKVRKDSENKNIIINIIDSKKNFENMGHKQIFDQMIDSMNALITDKYGLSSAPMIEFFKYQNRVINSVPEEFKKIDSPHKQAVEDIITNSVTMKKPEDDTSGRNFQLFSFKELLIMNKTKDVYMDWWNKKPNISNSSNI